MAHERILAIVLLVVKTYTGVGGQVSSWSSPLLWVTRPRPAVVIRKYRSTVWDDSGHSRAEPMIR